LELGSTDNRVRELTVQITNSDKATLLKIVKLTTRLAELEDKIRPLDAVPRQINDLNREVARRRRESHQSMSTGNACFQKHTRR
jgi:hypothetical protein